MGVPSDGGVSQRELAGALANDPAAADLVGDFNTRRETIRRQISRWRTGTQPDGKWAEALSRYFKRDPDFFKTTRTGSRTVAEALAEIRDDLNGLRTEWRTTVSRIESRLQTLEDERSQ